MNTAFITGLLVRKERRDNRVILTMSVKKMKRMAPEKTSELKGREMIPLNASVIVPVYEYYRISVYDKEIQDMVMSDECPTGTCLSVQARMARRKPERGERHSDVNVYFIGTKVKKVSEIKRDVATSVGPHARSAQLMQEARYVLSGYVANIYSPRSGLVLMDVKVKGLNGYLFFHLYYYVKPEDAVKVFETFKKGEYVSLNGGFSQKERIVKTEEGEEKKTTRTFMLVDSFNISRVSVDLVGGKDSVEPHRMIRPQDLSARKKNIYGMSPDDSASVFKGTDEYAD